MCPLVPLGSLKKAGINPRRLVPNVLWQMDDTHYSPFGKLQYIHVIIDKHSFSCVCCDPNRGKSHTSYQGTKDSHVDYGSTLGIKTEMAQLLPLKTLRTWYRAGKSNSQHAFPSIPRSGYCGKNKPLPKRRAVQGLSSENKKKKKGFSLNLGRANLQAKNILTLMMRVLALLINTALSSPGEILFPLVRWRDSLFNFWQPPPPR